MDIQNTWEMHINRPTRQHWTAGALNVLAWADLVGGIAGVALWMLGVWGAAAGIGTLLGGITGFVLLSAAGITVDCALYSARKLSDSGAHAETAERTARLVSEMEMRVLKKLDVVVSLQSDTINN
jgi:hypothetical protein